MSVEFVEPLPSEIEALIAAEKNEHPEDAALKAAVLSGVELAVALGGPSATPSPGTAAPNIGTASARKLVGVGLAMFALGGVAGAIIVSEINRSAPAVPIMSAPLVPTATSSMVAASSQFAPASQTAVGTAERSPAAVRSASSLPAPSAPQAVGDSRGDLSKEREVLDAARAALGRGRPADAIATAEQHATRWPRGYLGEEREVILIQALAASGKRDEAKRRAERFHTAFPKSMLGAAVDVAVGLDH